MPRRLMATVRVLGPCDCRAQTSTAFALCYLDNGFVYVGSRTGDSQLVRLVASAGAGADPVHDSQVQVLETYPNLGPITDLCVIDPERQGQVRRERPPADPTGGQRC